MIDKLDAINTLGIEPDSGREKLDNLSVNLGMCSVPGSSGGVERENEDRSFVLIPTMEGVNKGVYAVGVFDGVGGQEGGGEMAEHAMTTCQDLLHTLPEYPTDEELKEGFEKALIEAQSSASGVGKSAAILAGLCIDERGNVRMRAAWVGNCRLYMFTHGKESGKYRIVPLTLDDSPAKKLAEVDGEYDERRHRELMIKVQNARSIDDLGDDEQAKQLWKHREIITNSLRAGVNELHVNQKSGIVEPGDFYLAATDGLEALTLNEIAEIIERGKNYGPFDISYTLCEEIQKKRRSGHDDVTIVVLSAQEKIK